MYPSSIFFWDTSSNLKCSIGDGGVYVTSPAIIQAGTIFGTTYVQGAFFSVGGNQVLGARRAHIADAVGAAGDPPTQAEFNVFVGKFNFLLSELEAGAHGMFASS